jgi:hypothetical protein
MFFIKFFVTRLEKRLLIIRNLQSEKTIVNKQEEFFLSKEKFLQIRKKIPADKEIIPFQKEAFLLVSKTLPVH